MDQDDGTCRILRRLHLLGRCVQFGEALYLSLATQIYMSLLFLNYNSFMLKTWQREVYIAYFRNITIANMVISATREKYEGYKKRNIIFHFQKQGGIFRKDAHFQAAANSDAISKKHPKNTIPD